jgi:hypothetical protein
MLSCVDGLPVIECNIPEGLNLRITVRVRKSAQPPKWTHTSFITIDGTDAFRFVLVVLTILSRVRGRKSSAAPLFVWVQNVRN